MSQWKGIESMTPPHILMTVLSEEGIVGLLLYRFSAGFSYSSDVEDP